MKRTYSAFFCKRRRIKEIREVQMIDLPTKSEVNCADGIAGRSTYILANPTNDKITHLVVQSNRPPFHEYLVPVDQIQETTDGQIKLKCTRDELNKLDPFEYEEYI